MYYNQQHLGYIHMYILILKKYDEWADIVAVKTLSSQLLDYGQSSLIWSAKENLGNVHYHAADFIWVASKFNQG